IATLLFLGGWNTGLTPPLTQVFSHTLESGFDIGAFFGNLINVVVFIVKAQLLVFVMMWVRWTLPRLRIDQVMMTCLKYLLPISCGSVPGVGVLQVGLPWVHEMLDWLMAERLGGRVTPPSGKYFVKNNLTRVSLAVVLVTAFKIITTQSKLPTPAVPVW